MKIKDWRKNLESKIKAEPELNTWKGHLELRLPELQQILELANLQPSETVLELGCGNGLSAAFYSPFASKIIATDLPHEDHAKHAIGLEKAKRLISKLGVTNVEVMPADAQELPFENNTFDVVIHMFTLEHVPDKEKALREALRVLKPNGRLIMALPGSGWSLFYPIGFYTELGSRVLGRLKRKLMKSNRTEMNTRPEDTDQGEAPAAHLVTDWKSFRKVYPHFPIPKPHGEYQNYFEEIYEWQPHRWEELVRRSGFQPITMRVLSVLPRAPFCLTLGKVNGIRLHNRLGQLDRKLSSLRNLRNLSQGIYLEAVKGDI